MATANSSQKTGVTQNFVSVKEIRNGIVQLKNGEFRGILLCSSVNFGLKSAEEQRAIVEGFQTFLNTLDFSVQIVVNSRRMDLRPYLALLEEKMPDQQSELMRMQLREYMNFVRSFTDQANIMTKSFYVVVPYSPHVEVAKAVGMFGKNGSKGTPETSFEESRVQLEQRLAVVAGALAAADVRAAALGTEEIIELLYRSFNPGELENPIRLDQ